MTPTLTLTVNPNPHQVLDGSMLRDVTELRSSLGTELRGMRRDAMAAWLSGTRDDMRDEMNSAELRQCCDDAERRHHHLRGEEEGGEAQAGDRGFVWTLSPPQRARLHNTMLSAVRVRAVLKLEEEMRAYRQLMLAVRHGSQGLATTPLVPAAHASGAPRRLVISSSSYQAITLSSCLVITPLGA